MEIEILFGATRSVIAPHPPVFAPASIGSVGDCYGNTQTKIVELAQEADP